MGSWCGLVVDLWCGSALKPAFLLPLTFPFTEFYEKRLKVLSPYQLHNISGHWNFITCSYYLNLKIFTLEPRCGSIIHGISLFFCSLDIWIVRKSHYVIWVEYIYVKCMHTVRLLALFLFLWGEMVRTSFSLGRLIYEIVKEVKFQGTNLYQIWTQLSKYTKGVVPPIILCAPKSSSRHFIFDRKCEYFERYLWSVFHPSHRLLSRLEREITQQITQLYFSWWLGIFSAYFEQLN